MNDKQISARILQWVGLTMLTAFVVFWMLTGRESELLVGAAGSLVLAARYEEVRSVLRDATRSTREIPDTKLADPKLAAAETEEPAP